MSPDVPIAVVGMGGVFPGAFDLDQFWTNIKSGRDMMRPVPPGRWVLDSAHCCSATPDADTVASKIGSFITDFEPDLDGLAVDPDLVRRLDPLFEIVLHAGRRAFDGATDARQSADRTGVILAAIALPTDGASEITRQLFGADLRARVLGLEPARTFAWGAGSHPLNAKATGLPAALLAQALQLGGGTYTLDAACASSLYAIKLACDELRSGRADAMLAGGVSRPDCLYTQMGFTQLRALSPSGKCAPFDAASDGLVVGEGAGVVCLKRLPDAVAAGDAIHGVIRGIGLSNDIGGSLLAPDSEGQLRAMRQAYTRAGWRPDDVDLIECHGTGTPLGDAVEVGSLRTLWQAFEGSPGRCPIGSVKSMIGHLLTGAGAAGFIKTLLAMRHETLPPSANFERPADVIPLAGSPFRVQSDAAPWPRREADTPRRAAISAFGFGGINAHVLVEEYTSTQETVSQTSNTIEAEPIAIVGMDARFGTCKSLSAFRSLVLEGRSLSEPMPQNRWRGLGLDAPAAGAFLEDLAVPIGRYKMPPNEIPDILPQQLLMLESISEALSDAGQTGDARRPESGVIIGMMLDFDTTNFDLRWWLDSQARSWARELGLDLTEEAFTSWLSELREAANPALNAAGTVGALGGMIASRIAREFSFGGPSFGVSSDETSGLRAIEVAVRTLQEKAANMMVVGAVDLSGDVRSVLTTETLRKISPTGHPRPFDADADGILIGEGASSVVLKRKSDAERDGDRIYAVIRGIGAASSCDIETAYQTSFNRACDDAGIDPDQIDHFECHGSGDPAEDAAESAALARLAETRTEPTTIGSVKANIGHTGCVSGLASLVKSAVCLHDRVIPPLVGLEMPRGQLIMDQIALPRAPSRWTKDHADGPRRASVGSMTGDGNVVHVLLEQGDTREAPVVAQAPPCLFSISGDNVDDLLTGLAALGRQLHAAGMSPQELADHWFKTHGVSERHRLAVAIVGSSIEELARSVTRSAESLESDLSVPLAGEFGAWFTPEPVGSDAPCAFVFPGSGNHFPGMGQGLCLAWPEVLQAFEARTDRLATHFSTRWAWSVEPHEAGGDLRRPILGQVACSMLMAKMLGLLGLEPSAVVGYSLGESAGLLAMNAWPDFPGLFSRMMDSPLFKDDLAGDRHVLQSSGLSAEQAARWRAAILPRPMEAVRETIQGLAATRCLIRNTPSECVVGGLPEELREAASRLGCVPVMLDDIPTVHLEAVSSVATAYRALHLLETNPPPGVRFYSSAAGRAYEVTRDSAADSITRQATHGFDFVKVIESAYADGVRVFLEAGPGASCTRMIRSILKERPHLAVSASSGDVNEVEAVLRMGASLVTNRIRFDVAKLITAPRNRVAEAGIDERRSIVVPVGRPAPVVTRPRVPSSTPPARIAATPVEPVAAPILRAFDEAGRATADAHNAFLRFSQTATAGMQQLIRRQSQVASALAASGLNLDDLAFVEAPARESKPPAESQLAFSYDECMEFAVGKLGNVLGEAFAEVDHYPVRVRLPANPLMLVHRILEIEGEPRSLTSGRIVTEHDVTPDAWYLDGGRCPICITVEAGQADLFLSSYLGIDLAVKGTRAYRLLDATVTFHRDLPRSGEVIRYEIEILRFVRQGDTYLFFFQYDATIDGVPLLSMRDGCAGFFTDQEIEQSGGLILTKEETEPAAGRRDPTWRELVPCEAETYDDRQVEAFREGDLPGCFGDAFANLPLRSPATLPGGLMKLFDRVVELDPHGGRYGLGRIRAEADIHPDDWFLTCHFVDDMTMPGTLMYECCMHTLRFLLCRMGWVVEEDAVGYEPIPGISSALKCRGPVTPTTKMVEYLVDIKEIGYGPEPYVLADALMYADGRRVVQMNDMSMRLTGVSREQIANVWNRAETSTQQAGKATIYDHASIRAFAIGKPSEAFGDPYRVFDEERVIARLPGPPFQFLDRIVAIDGEPWVLKPGVRIEAEYDVPPDAWYFRANRQPVMPFAVLLEAGLQPCGWLAAYLGSALRSEIDLSFRNLGGKATLYSEVLPDAGTLSTRVEITKVSEAGGMIIESFGFEMRQGRELLYAAETEFGFFSKEALARQVGIRDLKAYEPDSMELQRARRFVLEDLPPFTPDDLSTVASNPAALPSRAFRMVDEVTAWVPDGGPAGLGFIRGSVRVDPGAWFFKAHFYQDPVWPGSLGLESFLQLLKVAAIEKWGEEVQHTHRFEPFAVGIEHEWTYRGQILPSHQAVQVEATVTRVEEGNSPLILADGHLSVDGTTIYAMKDFGIRLVRSET